MTFSQSISKQATRGRRFAVVAAVTLAVAMPATGQAGLFDKAKQGAQKFASTVTKSGKGSAAPANPIEQVKNDVRKTVEKVTEIGNGVVRIQGQVNQLVGNLHGEGAEQIKEVIQSTLQYLQHVQADYADYVAPDNCGASSDCGAFREDLRDMIDGFVALPGELPFVERVPAAVKQLRKFSDLVEFIPPPILFASDNVVGDSIDDIYALVEVLLAAAESLPEIPKARDIVTLSKATAAPYCSTVIGNPHIALVQVLMNNLAATLSDVAGLMADEKDVTVATVGTNVKNPAKAVFEVIVLVLNTMTRDLENRIALLNSTCAILDLPIGE